MAKDNKDQVIEKGSKFVFPKEYFFGVDIKEALDFLNDGAQYIISKPNLPNAVDIDPDMEFLGEENSIDYPNSDENNNERYKNAHIYSDEDRSRLGFKDVDDINPFIRERDDESIPIIDVPVNIRPSQSFESASRHKRMPMPFPSINGERFDSEEMMKLMEQNGGFFGVPNITLSPQNITIQPQTVTMTSQNVTMNPQTVTMNPEIVTMNPQTVTMNPQTVTMNPQTVTMNPQVVTMNPETVLMQPHTVNIQPEVVNIQPESVNINNPDKIILNSEAVVVRTDEVQYEEQEGLIIRDIDDYIEQEEDFVSEGAQEGAFAALNDVESDLEQVDEEEPIELGGIEIKARVVGVFKPEEGAVFYDKKAESAAQKAGISYASNPILSESTSNSDKTQEKASEVLPSKVDEKPQASVAPLEPVVKRVVRRTSSDPIIEEFGVASDADLYKSKDRDSVASIFTAFAEKLRRLFGKKETKKAPDADIKPEWIPLEKDRRSFSELTSVYDYLSKN